MKYKIMNVKLTLESMGINILTDEGCNAVSNKLMEIFPDSCIGWGYDKEMDCLDLDCNMYIPIGLRELGEVIVDGDSMG